jgi:predicted DNA-binding ribbon-helix-helix protein
MTVWMSDFDVRINVELAESPGIHEGILIEAPWLALPLRPLTALDQEQERKAPRRYRGLICGEEAVKSLISKRSIVVAGNKTSVSLEGEFWNSLKEIAEERGTPLAELVAAIDRKRQHSNLSSAIRLFVLGFYRDQLRKARP